MLFRQDCDTRLATSSTRHVQNDAVLLHRPFASVENHIPSTVFMAVLPRQQDQLGSRL